ncbi:FtsW/RodA/SpoVE family cell cycle protein [Candidatus Woesebacteria bacterium]|nr:FtsW/RodA/SpoVE family cell cycle protein [Candidatus Woesebacteria bacterium]
MRIRIGVGILLLIFGVLSTIVLGSVFPKEAIGQALFVILGLITYTVAQFIPRSFWKGIAVPLYVLVTILLVATLLHGRVTKGAVRWIPIGPVHVQVSELAKPALILVIAAVVSKVGLRSQRGLLVAMGLLAIPLLLILLQPDLGSGLVLLASAGGILLTYTRKLTLLIPWIVGGVMVSLLAWQFFLYPYQKARILSFVSSSENQDSSYNAQQALIAAGSGKLLGRGLGKGVQSNLKYLPEFHTDFFFASYAEELGYLGVGILLLLYCALFYLLALHAGNLDAFDGMYRAGLLYALLFQTVVHMGMNIGLSPVTGIPLPFLSSGGSSFISMALAVGIAVSLAAQTKSPGVPVLGLKTTPGV